MLARVLRDEPDWHDVLHVEPIELRTGTANLMSYPRTL